MAAIMFAAAFAGIMLAVDESDAAGEEAVEYTITYSYDGLVFSEKTTNGKLTIKPFVTVPASTEPATEEVKGAFVAGTKAPAGYEFSYWTSGSAVYEKNTEYIFTGDVTLTPEFKAAQPIVKLAYGDKAGEYMAADGSTTDYTIVFGATTTDLLKNVDLYKFATLIGAKPVTEEVKVDGVTTGYKITGFLIDGYRFCGFVEVGVEDAEPSMDFTAVKASGNKVVVYQAVFEKVYGVSFIVEGASVLETTSDKITITGQVASGDIPKAPSKANYLFMGWYNAAGEPVFTYSADLEQYSVPTEDFKITEETALYAKFVPVTFTVTFVYGEEKAVFTTETVKYGDLAIEPKGLPEGYKGWDWNFGTKIIADTEIVAIVADPVTVYTVTFEIDGKAPVTQRSDSMVLPDTKIEGKVFQGWVVKGESQYVSPMSYDITEDITFVAVYKEADPPAGPGFFETTTGQCVAVIIAVVIIALIYAVATNMFGLKDALTSVKITRVKK